MKVVTLWLVAITVVGLLGATAYAANAARGKVLFNDPHLGNGTADKSCNSCHVNGSGLEHSAGKKQFTIAGTTVYRLTDAVNICVVRRLHGKALAPRSAAMQNLISYIKSLKGISPILAPTKREVSTGC